MFTDYHVYVAYNKQRSLKDGTPYRIPGNWEIVKKRLHKGIHKDLLDAVTYYNDNDIDLMNIMDCGFDVFPNFSFNQLINKHVLKEYEKRINDRDKTVKAFEKSINKSFKNIDNFMKKENIVEGETVLKTFCTYYDGIIHVIMNMYIQGKIDDMTLTYCIDRGYITLNQEEQNMTDIDKRYDDYLKDLSYIESFIKDQEDKLDLLKTTKDQIQKLEGINVNIISEWDVYVAFRKAQSSSKNTPYRLPKEWESFKLKMNENNRQWLKEATMYFNTTYSNIVLDEYMTCGFEIWKSFSYKHFTHKKVIDLYIHKDKVKKRKLEVSKREIETTFNFISDELVGKPLRPGYNQLQNYCKFSTGQIRNIINMYVQSKIDIMTLIYCVDRKYLILTDDERAMTPYLVQRYRELMENLQDVKGFIKEMEVVLDEGNSR